MSRKPQDPSVYHGHHVVNGEELRLQFEPDSDGGRPRSRIFRRVRHAVMLILLVAIVVFGAGAAFAILTGHLTIPQPGSSPTPSMGCPAGPFDYAAPASVRVRVFNAAAREGLAKSIGDQLAQRKFAIAALDNSTVTGNATAIVVAGSAGESAAFTLQRNVPGSIFRADGRGDATVDLILLPAFKSLQDPGLVDQTPGPLVCSIPTPKPTASPSP